MEKKGFIKATVIDCKEIKKGSNTFVLNLECEIGRVEPGQFVVLQPKYAGSVMSRPLSVAIQVLTPIPNVIQLVIKNVGPNTELYSKLTRGDKVEVLGPLGRPFSDYSSNKYIFVAGGHGFVGISYPTFRLSQISKMQEEKEITVLLGAKNKNEIVDAPFREIAKVKTITEEGKNSGTVVDLLKKELAKDNGESVIVACGPKLMLKAVAELAKKYRNQCHVSMEEIMACGVGSCYGCTFVDTNGNHIRLCQEGPFVDASKVNWEKTLPAPKKVSFKKSPKTDKPMRTILNGKEGRKLILNYPTMTASGCFGIREAEESNLDFIGALVVKSIKILETVGNATPRVCETASGMINSIGLQNIGIERFLNEEVERWLALGLPVFVSIAGDTIDEFGELALLLADTDIAGIQGNVSCLNVHGGMLPFGVNPKDVYRVASVIRKNAPHKIVDIKLTPNVTDVAPQAQAADEGGADFISLVNTFPATDIDVWSATPKIANGIGGLSGPAILTQALYRIQQAVKAVKIPVVGMGGIRSGEDAVKFFMLGASAIAAGTGNFSGNVFEDINDGITKVMKHHNVNQVKDIIGCIKI